MYNWLKTTLGKHIELSTGFPFKSQHYTDSEKSIRLLRGDNVIQNSTRWEDAKRWPLEKTEGLNGYLLKYGDLVIAMDRTWVKAGLKIAVIDENDVPSLLVQRVARLRAKEGLSQRYLPYIVNSHKFEQYVKSVQTETAVPHISARQLRDFPVLLPPIAEQKRIVEVLEAWDSAIALTEQLITAKQKLKNSLVFKLLQSDLKISESSNLEWPMVKIKNIVQINPRLTLKPSGDSLVTFLRMADVQEGGGLDVSKSLAYKEVGSGYTAFQENDILIAKITPCFENYKGALARNLANGVGFGSTEFHVLRCGEKIKPDFLYQITLSYDFRGRGQSNMIGSAGQKRVPATFIKNYSIPLPSLEEQSKICDLFNFVDAEIQALTSLKKGYEQQKQGLMQKLLTGEWRVPVEAEVAA